MSSQQLKLPLIQEPPARRGEIPYARRFRSVLFSNLDFHGRDSSYASHNLHAFPAKFPPQLPRRFICELTEPHDVVLDPMVGSGTTIVEALLAGRRGVGTDIDPMALRLCRAKVTRLPLEETAQAGNSALRQAEEKLGLDAAGLRREMLGRFGTAERAFLDYWFLPETQLELFALLKGIEGVRHPEIRAFLELAFSAIIITKSGGVSLARDLAHTRPHKVQSKTPRSPLAEFHRRLTKNLESLATLSLATGTAEVLQGDAQRLPLKDESVDLIVTSPPYAANAIDYMRAHKFSLVWFGYPMATLSQLRRSYIGHDMPLKLEPIDMSGVTNQVLSEVADADLRKSRVLARYYSEMSKVLAEIARVLRSGKGAVVVVGSSTMRGIDTRTDACLGEIGKGVGLELVGIQARSLDRDKRMMPARKNAAAARSQIEERMHEEYVIGFLKPGACITWRSTNWREWSKNWATKH